MKPLRTITDLAKALKVTHTDAKRAVELAELPVLFEAPGPKGAIRYYDPAQLQAVFTKENAKLDAKRATRALQRTIKQATTLPPPAAQPVSVDLGPLLARIDGLANQVAVLQQAVAELKGQNQLILDAMTAPEGA